MLEQIARHPGIATFVGGSITLGALNAALPDNGGVDAVNTVTFFGGGAVGLIGASGKFTATNHSMHVIGLGALGAGLVGHAIGRAFGSD